MKKRIVIGIIAAGLTLLCSGALVFIWNYKPLVVKKEIPYYDEKIVAEVRDGLSFELSVYRTTSCGIFHGRKKLLEKELKFGSYHGMLDESCVELGCEGSQVTVKIHHNDRIWTEICRLK